MGKKFQSGPGNLGNGSLVQSHDPAKKQGGPQLRKGRQVRRCEPLLLFASCILLLPLTQFAAPTVYEPFSYSNGSNLAGKAGGIGFAGSWTTSSAVDGSIVSPGQLSYGQLGTAGGNLTAGVGLQVQVDRPLAANLGGVGTTTFVSVLYRPDAVNSAQDAGLRLMGSKGNTFFGKGSTVGYIDGTHYMINANGSQGASSITASSGTAVLLVLRADFGNGASTFKLFVNPTLGSEPNLADATASGDIGTVSGIEFSSSLGASIDEIRIGGTYADVASAVPERNTIVAGFAMAFLVVASSLKHRLEDRTARE